MRTLKCLNIELEHIWVVGKSGMDLCDTGTVGVVWTVHNSGLRGQHAEHADMAGTVIGVAEQVADSEPGLWSACARYEA
jgi:hypothetical protein